MKKKPAKKRNPQDSTQRNTQAANKRIKAVEVYCRFLQDQLDYLATRVEKLEKPPTRARR